MTKQTNIDAMDLEAVTGLKADLEGKIKGLRARLASIPGEIQDRTAQGDIDTVGRLLTEKEVLPLQLRAAEVALLNTRIRENRLRQAALIDERNARRAVVREALDKLKDAQAVVRAAQGDLSVTDRRVQSFTDAITADRRKLFQLEAEGSIDLNAPVVRSRPHAARTPQGATLVTPDGETFAVQSD